MDVFFYGLAESLKVTVFVLIMMLAVDYINVLTKGRLESILREGRKWKQYVIASLLGAAPGCLGSFAGVSLYIHGMISFGALTGLMLATAGDEQFVMLALFPKTALIMFGILFFLGIAAGYITDYLTKKFNIKTCADCPAVQYHEGEKGWGHYWLEHIWSHIIKRHLLKIFLWTLAAILIIECGQQFLDLKNLTAQYSLVFLFVAAIMGIIPESGPHLIFVMLYAKGLIPFSILFASSVVQDGHGMLPMLSFSIKDSIRLKLFNLLFGIITGLIIYLAGY